MLYLKPHHPTRTKEQVIRAVRMVRMQKNNRLIGCQSSHWPAANLTSYVGIPMPVCRAEGPSSLTTAAYKLQRQTTCGCAFKPLTFIERPTQRPSYVVKEIRSTQQIMRLFDPFVDGAPLSNIMSTIELYLLRLLCGILFSHHPYHFHQLHQFDLHTTASSRTSTYGATETPS
jgi:hypothetical protein